MLMTRKLCQPAGIVLLALFSFGLIASAAARPAKVIILRHGEKENDFALCNTGVDRSLALAAQYLGQGAKPSLFTGKDKPAAFLAITLHTLELASPAAATWQMPVVTFTSVPLPGVDLTPQFNLRTQQAVGALMNDRRYDGKTVVMVWEHHHIADRELELKFPDQRVSLRQLLNLDKLKGVPETWPVQNYNYFWIVEFGKKTDIPTSFKSVKQDFSGTFASVPSNDWGTTEPLPQDTKCLH
jgi:hypothetical protein